MRLGPAVALEQVLGRERALLHDVAVGVVHAAQLERIDLELGGELVEQALEAERALDETRSAEGGVRASVELRAVLDGGDVRTAVEHLHRPRRPALEAAPADGHDEVAGERGQRPVGLRAGTEPLDGRMPVSADQVLLAARERAADGPSGALGDLRGDERVLAGMVLRAEAAAHEVADDAHLVLRDAELLGGLRAHAPDELRRGVEVEDVAFPLADRLVRLHRVVQDGLRPVLGLDHDVGLGEAALDVAAVVALGLVDQRALPDRLVRVEQGLEHLPLDVDQADGRLGLLERVGRDGRDRCALVGGLAREDVEVVRGEDRAHARGVGRGRQVELRDARVRVRAAQDRGVEHPGKLEVGRVDGLAAGALGPVDALRRLADGLARPGGPRLDRVLVDHDPLLGVVALDFFFGADQSCHVRTASSIFG